MSYTGHTVNRKMRIAAGVLTFALILFVLFSVFFIAHEADHECTGEDCPVCAFMHVCEDNLRSVGDGSFAAFCASARVLFSVLTMVMTAIAVVLSTPISTKVRMNN